jgi:pimeloyl-ACP methyl ester carboxylesterase
MPLPMTTTSKRRMRAIRAARGARVKARGLWYLRAMAESALFVSAAARDAVRAACDAFRARHSFPSESRTVTTSLGATHALLTGPEGGTPLVVLHGARASSAHVLPELGSLVTRRRVIAIDVVGQSPLSEDRRVALGDPAYGPWLHEACAALGLDRFALLGVSFGGLVAAHAARHRPERLTHLALLAPAGFVQNGFWKGLREGGFAFMAYKMSPTEARLDALLATIVTEMNDEWRAYFGVAMPSFRQELDFPPRLRDGDLAAVRCPALVLGAELDGSFPGRPLLDRAKALLPQAELELLEGSKHCPPFTEAFRERLAARLDRFLGAS